MKTIDNTPTGQIVRDVFGDRLVPGQELARFIVGLAFMKSERDGLHVQHIVEEFGKLIDAQNDVIAELRGERHES